MNKEEQKQYYIDNRERILKRTKQYYIDNPKLKKELNKKYYKENKEQFKEYHKKNREKALKGMVEYHLKSRDRMLKYYKTMEYRTYSLRHSAKRRKLGFFPLNKYFKGAVGHHISQNFVIYIPADIHISISHNIWTWYNMDKINKIAIESLR